MHKHLPLMPTAVKGVFAKPLHNWVKMQIQRIRTNRKLHQSKETQTISFVPILFNNLTDYSSIKSTLFFVRKPIIMLAQIFPSCSSCLYSERIPD